MRSRCTTSGRGKTTGSRSSALRSCRSCGKPRPKARDDASSGEAQDLFDRAAGRRTIDKGSVVDVLLGVLRLVDDFVVGLGGGAGEVAGVDGSVRIVFHAEAAVLVGASGSALLVVLGLLGRLI